MSVYRASDIRGIAGRELSAELYTRWGLALGFQVGPGAKFVVGGDVRPSTPAFLSALVKGLCQAGVDVVDVGALPTPMIHYARRRLKAAGCAIVTGSHSPAKWNGLKWMVGNRPPSPRNVRTLREAGAEPRPKRNNRRPTRPRSVDVTFDYVAWLQETWVDGPPLPRPVVLDARNGVWARRARRYLQAVFPHSIFSAIRDEPGGPSACRLCDCAQAESLEELSRAVYQQRAALGIAFDGDGDRVAFVDDDGNPLTAEEATWVLLQSFAGELEGEPFVYDLKFSDRVAEAARRLGAAPLVERSGPAFVRRRMLSARARFGAETSGRYFFRELEGGDDGLLAACRMIAHLARSGKSLGRLRGECPEVFVTPDLRVAVKPRQLRAVFRQVRTGFAKYPQSGIDGLRVEFPNGWALVRRSASEPGLTFRFEAADGPGLAKLVWRFARSLPEIGEALWTRYEEAIGLAEEER